MKGEVIVSANTGLERLVADLGSPDSGIRTEAIGNYCRYLMIEGEVEVSSDALNAVTAVLLNDQGARNAMKTKLETLKQLLGQPGCARVIAKEILEDLD